MCDATRFRLRIAGQEMPAAWRWWAQRLSLILPESGVSRLRLEVPTDPAEWQRWRGGEPVSLSLGFAEEFQPVFDGEVTGLHFLSDADGQARVALEAHDKLHRLGRNQRQRVFLQVTETALIQQLVAEVGLQAQVEDPGGTQPAVTQNSCTSLQLLEARAARLGYVFWLEGRTMYFRSARLPGVPVTVAHGEGLVELETFRTVARVTPSVQVLGYDPLTAVQLRGRALSSALRPTELGRPVGAGQVGQAFPAPVLSLGQIPVRSVGEATAVSRGQLTRRARQLSVARGTCAGTAALAPGCKLTLEGVPGHCRGAWEVCGVEHTLFGNEGYLTRFEARRNV